MNTRLSSLLVAGCIVLAGISSEIVYCASSVENHPNALKPVFSLTDITIDPTDQERLIISIPRYLDQPRVQVLHSPDRVVLDFVGVYKGDSINKKKTEPIVTEIVKKVRIAQFATSPNPITRVVFEVVNNANLKIASNDGRYTICADRSNGTVNAVFSNPVTQIASNPANDKILPSVGNVSPDSTIDNSTRVIPPNVNAVRPEVIANPSINPLSELRQLPSVGALYSPLPVLALTGLSDPKDRVDSRERITSSPTEEPKPTASRTLGEVGHKYTGSRLTIDVQGADLVTFLRILADTGKFNLIVDPDIAGNYSFKFVDTPWDQILDVILKHAGLGKEFNNGVLRVAKNEKLQKEEEDRKRLDETRALAGDLQSISRALSYAKVTEVNKILEKIITKRGSLIIDERTNTIIITDLPKNIIIIDDLIAQLDVQIQQVQIEARVVEASKGYEKAFGVKWPQTNSGSAQLNTYVPNPTPENPSAVQWASAPWVSTGGAAWNGISNRPEAGQNSVALGLAPGKDQVTSIASPAGEFWVSFLSNRMSLNVILQALEKEGVVKIVSAPKVVTQNNKKATIMSGEKIPYPTIQAGSASGAITVAFAEANLQLDVTPQITNENTIIMDIKVEKAEADFSRTVNGTPTILRKMVETQVLVKDGGTAVLGGVYTTNTNTGSTGVPFLSKLPILGWLFRSKSLNEKNSELLVFITPRIVKS